MGMPDVIAMGTLPLGLILSVVEPGYGPRCMAEFNVRFHDALLPGLAIDLTVRAAAGSSAAAPAA